MMTLLLLSLRPAQAGQEKFAPLGSLPGEEVLLDDCLRVSVVNLTNRSGDLSNYDWATVSITNECNYSRRHLQASLLLVDHAGNPYGTKLWLLSRGETLRPGQKIIVRHPIPDKHDMVPVRWAIRLLGVEKPYAELRELAMLRAAQAEKEKK